MDDSPILVLPVRDALWACRQDATGTIAPEAPINIERGDDDVSMQRRDAAGVHDVVTSPEGWVAVRSQGGRALHVLRIEEGTVQKVNVSLPGDLAEIHDMSISGSTLFVAGRPKNDPASRLGLLDLRDPKPVWRPMPLPDGGLQTGAIVRLVIENQRLLAIDASFTPKQLLVFDLTIPHEPSLAVSVRIPSGLDDRIISAAAGRSFFAILSASHHKDGKAWKLGIYDRERLDEVSTFFVRADWSEPLNIPSEVIAMDDLFLIAHGLDGMGVVRLKDQRPTRFGRLPGLQPWSQPLLPAAQIRYSTPLGPGRVLALRALPGHDRALAVVRQGSKTWWETLELP